jgi:Flp pilus assembly protein TadD
MRVLLFTFVLVFSISASAQSPTVINLFAEGTMQANAGRFDDALKNFKTVLFMAENEYLGAAYRAHVHYNIGVCYFRLNRFDPAIDHFKAALLLKADYTRAHYALGMAEMRKRNSVAAVSSFNRVLKLDPKNGEAWFDLAFASLALNDFETAEKAFAKSIEFGSVDANLSHNNIGVILAFKGDLAGAEDEFETAIQLSNGRLTEARRNLEFCRSKHAGNATTLIAREDFVFAPRTLAMKVG